MSEERDIQFVLDCLWQKTKDLPGGKSNYADEILNFFGLENRFYVNALVFKSSMSHKLPQYIKDNSNILKDKE